MAYWWLRRSPCIGQRGASGLLDGEMELNAGSAGVSPARPEGPQSLGWRSRGYLPHFDGTSLVQFITFRLADALPASKLEQLEHHPSSLTDASRRRRLEAYLDAGHGACYLGDKRIARLVEAALCYFDGQRYRLLAWVVMPNHVHVIIELLGSHTLSEIAHSWKSFTAKEANKLLGRGGRFWQVEYYERSIRDERHLSTAVQYIHDNPVKAGLARQSKDWLHSSAALVSARLGDEAAPRAGQAGRLRSQH
jgi:REP element-mobilizing transposase RayT